MLKMSFLPGNCSGGNCDSIVSGKGIRGRVKACILHLIKCRRPISAKSLLNEETKGTER